MLCQVLGNLWKGSRKAPLHSNDKFDNHDEKLDLPEPSDLIDNAMLCDIQKYAYKFAEKAEQLIGKQV